MKKKVLMAVLLWAMVLSGCSLSGEADRQQEETAEPGSEMQDDAGDAENKDAGAGNAGNGDIGSGDETQRPTEEEVLAMREQVLEGMSEEAIGRLAENIKVANQRMESAYLYDALFEKLEDAGSLYWNYFDQKGEIQVGWTYDGNYQEIKEIMEKENLSKEEFYSRYGTPEMVYNRFDAGNFMDLMEEMKTLVKNEKLQEDLQRLIDETGLAAETHGAEHASNIYKILHDMDYYLLRYGPEDVGQYVQDTSTIGKYYGVLSVYE